MNDIEMVPVARVITGLTFIIIIIMFTGTPELYVARRSRFYIITPAEDKFFSVLTKHHAVEMIGE